MHRVRKNRCHYIFASNFASADRSSKFVHRQTLQWISNKAIVKCPTAPWSRCEILMVREKYLKHALWLTIHHSVILQCDLGVVGRLISTLLRPRTPAPSGGCTDTRHHAQPAPGARAPVLPLSFDHDHLDHAHHHRPAHQRHISMVTDTLVLPTTSWN